jgi:DNA primase
LAKNRTAFDYLLKDRGYSKQIISEFEIGYAPKKGDVLSTFLTKRGFTAKEMREAGLVSPRGGRNLDMFRGRVVLPLKDGQGRTIGFTGRVLDDGLPKYLNTPQTLAYDKSGNVFGLSLAKEAIRQEKFAVVVEGNLDVVAAHMAGTKNVVAVAGTAMTRRHLNQLVRLTEDIRLAFDADDAGFNATLRAIPIAQETGVSLSIINITGGKDPDDIIKASPARWKAMIKRSQYVVDWVIEQMEAKYDLSSAQGKREFSSQALTVIAGLADAVEKDHFISQLAAKLGIAADALREKLGKTLSAQPRLSKRQPKSQDSEAHVSTYQDLLIGLMLRYPEVRESLENVRPEHFDKLWRQETINYLDEADRKPIVKTPKSLQEYDTYVNIALLRTEELYGPWSASDRMIESIGLARRLLNDYKKTKKHMLTKEISDAEAAGDDARRARLLKDFDALIKGDKNAGITTPQAKKSE